MVSAASDPDEPPELLDVSDSEDFDDAPPNVTGRWLTRASQRFGVAAVSI